MKLEKLLFHELLLPALKLQDERSESTELLGYKEAQAAAIFDCRNLPAEFVDDTGSAAFEEWKALNRLVRLPFSSCYFEFSDSRGVLACEADVFNTENTFVGTCVEFKMFYMYPKQYDSEDGTAYVPTDGEYIQEFRESLGSSYGEFSNGVVDWQAGEPSDFCSHVNAETPFDELEYQEGSRRLVGVLALLSDKLLATEIKPDDCPALNRARAKKGKPPLSAERRVLTINAAAVRRAVTTVKLGRHESPRLHWRRGHWRVNHRFSEFESRSWVRRCLVGDASRGFVHKDYRLAWAPPMLGASSPGVAS